MPQIIIKPTNEIVKAINKYHLHIIHTGSIATVPNNRYVRAKEMCFNEDELVSKYGLDLSSKNFVMVLNHCEVSHACWTVWETPKMDYENAKTIYQAEHWRRLWDTSHLYYDDGEKLLQINCIEKVR